MMQSIITEKIPALSLLAMERDIGHDMESYYQRLIAGKTRVSCKVLTDPELYVYAGVIGLYYGPTSHKFDHITKNLIQYARLDMKQIKARMNKVYRQCMKPMDYSTTFDLKDTSIMDDDVTILMLSNFGTGMPRSTLLLEEAKRVAPEISLMILAGDTYYSGTAVEQEKNLIQPIRTVFPNAMVRYLRGSHDMYSGPEGFALIKTTFGQQSSYFSLRNHHLMIQAMDTSYLESLQDKNKDSYMTGIRDDELEWHLQCIKEAHSQEKKILLLSYHEPITYKDPVGLFHKTHPPVNVHLTHQLKPMFPLVHVYFFGHQHGFMLYEDYPLEDQTTIRKPRLIGHGGSTAVDHALDSMYVPGKLDTSLYPLPTLLPGEEWHIRHNGSIMDSGFCILRCKEGKVTAEYYNLHFTHMEQEPEPAVCVYREEI